MMTCNSRYGPVRAVRSLIQLLKVTVCARWSAQACCHERGHLWSMFFSVCPSWPAAVFFFLFVNDDGNIPLILVL